jgi:hypothetical protein
MPRQPSPFPPSGRLPQRRRLLALADLFLFTVLAMVVAFLAQQQQQGVFPGGVDGAPGFLIARTFTSFCIFF